MATDNNGNNGLHFAAKNEHRGVIEVLLRSGAEPSIPNHDGLLPVELSQNPVVKDLFLRDGTHLFSPMQQARALFAEYVQQHQNAVNKVNDSSENSSKENSGKVTTNAGSKKEVRIVESNNRDNEIDNLNTSFQTQCEISEQITTPMRTLNRETYTNYPTTPQSTSQLNGGMFNQSYYTSYNCSQGNVDYLNISATSSAQKSYSTFGNNFMNASNSYLNNYELQFSLVQAAQEVALTAFYTSDEIEVFHNAENLCKKCKDVNNLKKYIQYHPLLPIMRLPDKGDISADGKTLLHVAAYYGNVEALQFFQQECQNINNNARAEVHSDVLRGAAVNHYTSLTSSVYENVYRLSQFSFWVRDLRGRTPLHFAAMRGHDLQSETAKNVEQQGRADRTPDRYPIHGIII